MKLRCRFGWHNWSRWSDKFSEQWAAWRNDTGVKTRSYERIFQDRRCQDCREIQKVEVRA